MPSTSSENNYNKIRSEEVQELISRIPSWIVRWGISMIFIVFLIFLLIAWFIKYPDVLKAKIMITSNPAPVEILARIDGPLALLKEDGAKVKTGETLAFIKSEVNYDDVLLIENLLKDIEDSLFASPTLINFSENNGFRLGSLSQYEVALKRDIDAWLSFVSQKSYLKQIEQLTKQQESLILLRKNQQQQLDIYKNEMLISTQKFMADSILNAQKVTAPIEFSELKKEYIREQRAYKNTEASLLNNQLQYEQLQLQIIQIASAQVEDEKRLKASVRGGQYELREQINRWKQQYVIRSPFDGKLAYLQILQNEKMVKAGNSLFMVLPHTEDLYAYAELPLAGSGKVIEGQDVNIRLESYPHEQYGMLTGRVVKLFQIPNEKGYILEIDLLNGLQTTYNKQLVFRHNLTGQTEIITEDLRLLERVFYQFRKLLMIGK